MQNEKKEIRYADLFGGVGGFRLGIEKATKHNRFIQSEDSQGQISNTNRTTPQLVEGVRTKCVFYNDIDKYAVQTYNKNFKENWEATDIRTIKTDSIPDFDMLCGGFPCQAFSIAGKRRGFKDTRGTLFFEIARIIKAKRPKIIFLENVKGLLNHEKGKTFSVIIQTLSELGYDVQWMVLNSKFFGVPQNRERVFIIGSLRGTSRPEILPFGESHEFFDKEERREQEEKERICSTIDSRYGALRNSGETYMIYDIFNKKMRSNQKVAGTLKGEGTSETSLGTALINPEFKIRRLTPIECCRLQGFPDNWTEGVSDTQRYKQMGNAVTVNVIQAIVERLMK